jgi:DNA-binding response OmpR family regulator
MRRPGGPSAAMSARVLVVDDEPSVQAVARAYLEREGFTVDSATDGLAALAAVDREPPDLIVLDLMLPGASGEQVAARVRARSDVPILMLTAKASEEERLRGFAAGADDYLVKPFSPRELVARVRAILRRSREGGAPPSARTTLDDGRLRIDELRHEVRVDDRPVGLTPTEFRLLVTLASYPGRVYSRFELIERIQGSDFEGDERTIDAHVKNLRRKLEPDPAAPRYVQTVHGVGYRLGVGRR